MKLFCTILTLTFLIHYSTAQTSNGIPLKDLEHGYSFGTYIDTLGQEIEGELSYSELYPDYFYFKKVGETPEKIPANAVSKILVDEIHFVSIENQFYKKENEEIKIQVFSKFHSKASILGHKINSGEIEGQYNYYVIIENEKIINISDLSLSPFHKKVPSKISTCESLAKKVESKEKGYKTSLLTPPYLLWLKIAEEYEVCQ